MKIGKRTKLWNKYRAELKKEFAARGIVRCEICGTDFGLSFAHSKKRKDIYTEQDWKECALLCIPDHEVFERMPPPEMTVGIREIINRRNYVIYN